MRCSSPITMCVSASRGRQVIRILYGRRLSRSSPSLLSRHSTHALQCPRPTQVLRRIHLMGPCLQTVRFSTRPQPTKIAMTLSRSTVTSHKSSSCLGTQPWEAIVWAFGSILGIVSAPMRMTIARCPHIKRLNRPRATFLWGTPTTARDGIKQPSTTHATSSLSCLAASVRPSSRSGTRPFLGIAAVSL